jgi:hypothetical protein
LSVPESSPQCSGQHCLGVPHPVHNVQDNIVRVCQNPVRNVQNII